MFFAALLSGIAFGSVVFIVGRLFGPGGAIEEEENFKKRIAEAGPDPAGPAVQILKKSHVSESEALKKLLGQYKLSDKIAVLLSTLRLKISVSVFLSLCLLTAGLCFLLLQIWLSPWTALALALAASFVPYFYLSHRRKRYLAKFGEHLPDALSIISNSIKAGHSLEVAIDTVSRTAPYPVSEEFGVARAEMRLGVPLAKALEHLDGRIENHELKILITGISIQQELGGNLGEILHNLEKTIRDRFAILREIGTLSAQGKYSAWILMLIPVGLVAIYLKNNPKLFFEFLNSGFGGKVLWLVLIFDIVGFLWMRRIVKLQD